MKKQAGKEYDIVANYENDREVQFDIIEEIGVLSTKSTGWSKELNVVRWNGGAARYDIREWDPYHESMSKGLTFDEQEMRRVVDLLKRRKRYAYRTPVKPREEACQDFAAETAEPLTEALAETITEDLAEEPVDEIVEEEAEEIGEEISDSEAEPQS